MIKLLVEGYWKGAWDKGKEIFNTFKNNIEGIVESVKSFLSSFFDWIIQKVEAAINAINRLRGAGGAISGGAGSVIAGAVTQSVSSYSLDVPALASGSVIRGGDPFLAVLGDQPSNQTNVEAPLSTIEQALENVMDRRGDTSGGISPTISLNVNGQEFARLTLGDILREMRIQGYDVEVLGVT